MENDKDEKLIERAENVASILELMHATGSIAASEGFAPHEIIRAALDRLRELKRARLH